MQVFGSKGWVEVGDVEHLTTWQMRMCLIDPDNLMTHHKPQVVTFPETSTERAELESFADAVAEGRRLAVAGGDEEHGVAVLEAIMESARSGSTVKVGAAPSVASRRAASKSESPVAVKAKRLLKRVKKTLREVVKKATAAPAATRTPAAKKKTARTAAKKSTRRANARTERTERRATTKTTRNAAQKRPATTARRASAKKKAPRRK
jgi:CCR4-NOT transcriptional regulation complex NOT5 subunit